MPLDLASDLGKRAAQRLRDELIIWLVTVRADGLPQASPVWFIWDGGEEVLLFSMPNAPKVENIRRNPKVSLHFNCNATGADVIIFRGEARLSPDEPRADKVPAMHRKYVESGAVAASGMTLEYLAAKYSMPIRLKLSHLRGF